MKRELAAALGLHVAVALALWSAPPTKPAPEAPAATSTEVDLESALAAPVMLAARVEEPRSAPAAEARVLGRSPGPSRAEAADASGDEAAAATGGTAEGPAAAASQTPFRITVEDHVDLGLGGGVRDATILAEHVKPQAGGPGLAAALDAQDAERGLGRGGPARSAVEEAARGKDAPTFGIATFSIAIGADGAVDVRLADASVDRPGWAALSQEITESLKKKPIRLAPNQKSLRVTVRVEASEKFPEGMAPTPDAKQGVSVHASAGKITETKDHIEIEIPSVVLAARGRKCGGGIVLTPGGISGGGGCAAGVAMRVVKARIVSEERL